MDEEEQLGLDSQQLFETYQAASSEEEYADMLMRNLEQQNVDDEELTTENDDRIQPQPVDSSYAGYMAPTMASVLPPYLCGEVERVRNSYRTGSYNSIKQLPTNLQAGQIRQTRKQHITENLLINSNNVFKPASVLKNEPFHKPEYIGTDFEKMKNLHKYLLDEEKVQTDSLSRKPFVIQSRIRAKTEDIFHDPEYRFPGMGPGTGLKKMENMLRDNSDDDKIILEPGYILQSKLNAASGLQVKEWTQKIHAKLVRDWSQYKFRVKFTKSNELVIQFQKPVPAPSAEANKSTSAPLNVIFPPPNNTLNKYMHNLATHGLAGAFGLKKRGDRWNIIEVEYVNSNGSKDGTIPTYGTEPVSPYKNMTPSMRKSQSANSITPMGKSPHGGGGSAGGSADAGDDKHKSVRWFSRTSTENSWNSNSGGEGIGNNGTGNGTGNTSGAGSGQVSGSAIVSNIDRASNGSPHSLNVSSSISPVHSILHSGRTSSPTGAGGGSSTSASGPAGSSGVTPRSGNPAASTPRSVTFASPGIAAVGIAGANSVGNGSVGGGSSAVPTAQRASPVFGASASPPSVSSGSNPGSRGNSPEEGAMRDTHASYDHLRPPRIATYQDIPVAAEGAEGVEENSITDKLYYLTFSFYAPWIHTGHMNVRRAMGYHNRLKAKKFGENFHQKYNAEPRQRLDTEDTESSVEVYNTNYAQGGAIAFPLPANYTHGMYDSFKGDQAGGSAASTPHQAPHVAAGRFMTSMMRDQRFNNT